MTLSEKQCERLLTLIPPHVDAEQEVAILRKHGLEIEACWVEEQAEADTQIATQIVAALDRHKSKTERKGETDADGPVDGAGTGATDAG